ncbi:GPW/gp25 family protein [Chitinophaga horti]|uniref:GPW/gp25 family protein n=1 Tax=Chitinophaga horti TaxID=2920382 RepID=A0ABY6J5F7_9BACT|nr:GPW/gp25 family protein [Chitinophaga horti]UYQ93536.1 GPW/gp25 family protein [Chitinophaga horti]
MADQPFLGRGWSFPPVFSKSARQVAMLEGEEDIHSSLDILLSTTLGERVMQPRYGCDMKDLLFESVNTSLKALMADRVKTALLFFEPRIETEKIDILTDNSLEGLIQVQIVYRVRSTNSRMNYVFPFYRNEGTEIPSSQRMAAGGPSSF